MVAIILGNDDHHDVGGGADIGWRLWSAPSIYSCGPNTAVLWKSLTGCLRCVCKGMAGRCTPLGFTPAAPFDSPSLVRSIQTNKHKKLLSSQEDLFCV